MKLTVALVVWVLPEAVAVNVTIWEPIGAWPLLPDGTAPPRPHPITLANTTVANNIRLIRNHKRRSLDVIVSPSSPMGNNIANASPSCDSGANDDVVAATVIVVAMFAGEVLPTVTVEFAGVHVM